MFHFQIFTKKLRKIVSNKTVKKNGQSRKKLRKQCKKIKKI